MIGSMQHIIHVETHHFHHTTTIWGYIQHFGKMSFCSLIAYCVKLCHHMISHPLDYMFGKGNLFLKLFWAQFDDTLYNNPKQFQVKVRNNLQSFSNITKTEHLNHETFLRLRRCSLKMRKNLIYYIFQIFAFAIVLC